MKTHRRFLVSITLTALILYADNAFAQIAGIGGGGGGLLSGIIQWFVTNIIQGLLAAAVLLAGCMLLFSRHTMAGLAVAAIGALVVSNYQTIAGFFAVGG